MDEILRYRYEDTAEDQETRAPLQDYFRRAVRNLLAVLSSNLSHVYETGSDATARDLWARTAASLMGSS